MWPIQQRCCDSTKRRMSSHHFYSSLPALERLLDLADPACYMAVPKSWYIIVADVVKSTDAIAVGRYKDVNLIGASAIIAVVNVVKPVEIPFVFGGDGASFAIPPTLLAASREALLCVQQLAQTNFNLNLRIGIVPVEHITSQSELKIAKLRITPNCSQACFLGGGMTYATRLVKTNPLYRIEAPAQTGTADLTGLECRWQDIHSPHGHTISLIVDGTASSTVDETCYQEVLRTIEQIYGSPENYHPITQEFLKLSFSPKNLRAETKARSPRRRDRPYYLLKIFLENILGTLLMVFKATLDQVNWGRYKSDVIAATDYQKIDDVLHMVISGTPTQTHQLTRYLERQYQQGRLVFGLHVSNRALMTCLILSRRDRHIHLVDGADGGYTLAAKQLKERLETRSYRK